MRAAELVTLGSVDYRKSRKTIAAFAGRAAESEEPRCASWEVDRAEFMPLDRAREVIHLDQKPLLDRLVAVADALEQSSSGTTGNRKK